MESDTELDTWRREWQTDDVIPPDLRQRVERETRNLRRAVYAQVAVTAIIGGGVVAWALVSQRPNVLTLAIGVWFFIAVAWVISIGLSREIMKPSAATTTAFVELSIRRCRNRLQALIAQCLLYVMILTFDLVWIYYYKAETRSLDLWTFLTSGRLLVVWPVTATLVAAAVWYRLSLHRELQNLLNLRRQLGDSAR
jgi:hypothetical protein